MEESKPRGAQESVGQKGKERKKERGLKKKKGKEKGISLPGKANL